MCVCVWRNRPSLKHHINGTTQSDVHSHEAAEYSGPIWSVAVVIDGEVRTSGAPSEVRVRLADHQNDGGEEVEE